MPNGASPRVQRMWIVGTVFFSTTGLFHARTHRFRLYRLERCFAKCYLRT